MRCLYRAVEVNLEKYRIMWGGGGEGAHSGFSFLAGSGCWVENLHALQRRQRSLESRFGCSSCRFQSKRNYWFRTCRAGVQLRPYP